MMVAADHPFFLAHEQAHQELHHAGQRRALWLVITSAATVVALALQWPWYAVIMAPASALVLSAPLWLWWMRRQELAADFWALQNTSVDAALQALTLIPPQKKRIFATHPSKEQRLRAIFL